MLSRNQKTSNIDMKKGFWHDITLPLTNWSRYFNRKKKKSWTPQTPGCSYLIKCWHCFCRELKHLEHKEILSVWCSSFGSSPSPYLQYAQEIHKEAPGGLFLPFSCFLSFYVVAVPILCVIMKYMSFELEAISILSIYFSKNI